ncbi:MAG TPA: peptidoglycan-binding domain-containing protein, partial [Candidatus Omnitrophota bacterium]|nr:peptidoglycan-binding domain-containing protein [Candidatus Omnitrophota bacterium]
MMGMGDSKQQTSQGPSGTAARSADSEQKTPARQQYPQGAQTSQADQGVMQIQRQLGQRGYDVGPVDGLMGESTQSALRNFQRDQGLPTTGQADQQTLAALGMAGGQQQRMSQQQQQQQRQQDYAPMTRRQGAMMEQQPPRAGMGMRQQAAMDPNTVRNIQQQLDRRGYDVGEVDGIWGPRTSRAVTAFQRDENLNASGRLDQQTL